MILADAGKVEIYLASINEYHSNKINTLQEDFTMQHYTIGKYERISKATAKKEYMQGKTIAFCPCKVNPENKWIIPYCVNRQQRHEFVIDDIGALNDFVALVNSYEYYNCQHNETGKYCAFYRLLA